MRVRITKLPYRDGDMKKITTLGGLGDSYEDECLLELLKGRKSMRLMDSDLAGTVFENLDWEELDA